MIEIQNQAVKESPVIMVVDDIIENLKLLGNILTNEGFKVRQVTNGPQALKVALKELPSLILLDIMMPEMDGFEVCRQLKEDDNLKDIPVIFISALNETESIVRALNSGGADYVNKPFQPDEIIARVNTHLKLRSQSIELQKHLAAKDKFFSIIAHDLRSPLSGMATLTQLLVENTDSITSEFRNEIILNLNDSMKNTYNLLINLFEWAQINRGLAPYNPQKLNLQTVINSCMNISSEPARLKEININSEIADDLFIFADINMIQLIIRNLVSNAIKYTHTGGSISVSASHSDNNMTKVSVRDTGIGIPDEIKKNLFFIETDTKRPGTGGELSTGLGLVLCKEYIEMHKGEIWVESESGKGSEFHFTLPNHTPDKLRF